MGEHLAQVPSCFGLATVCLYLAYRDTIPMLKTYDYQVALS